MENIKELSFIEENPSLKKDINLFKLMFMPLELFILKYFFINLHPTNIREIYTESIFICFHNLFKPETLENPKYSYKFLIPNLISAGYGYGFINLKEREKIFREYVQEMSGVSETKQREKWLTQIKKYNSKTPSYDKIKAIFEKFNSLGILYKIGKEGKGIAYTLNPQFYYIFKEKRNEIIKL